MPTLSDYIPLCLLLVLVKNVCLLDCFTTDLSLIRHGVYHTRLQNCEDYITTVLQLRGLHNVKLPSDIDFRCFTVRVERDRSFGVAVRGCVPYSGCGTMQSVVKSVLEKDPLHGLIKSVQCNECRGSECNKPTYTKFQKLMRTNEIEA